MFSLTDGPETGKPVVDMTKTEYVLTWMLALGVGLFLARMYLVNPIIDAIRATH